MRKTTKRMPACALVAALLGALAGGCSLGGDSDAEGDKAGGSDAPQVLRLAAADDADQPDARFVRYFASRVSRLSERALRVRVVWDAAGQASPGYERGIARLVRDDRFELGWMGARAWDRMGITRFQALQAPFLVTDHDLLGRIATGPLAARMLAGLDGHGFVGLALVPDRLRYPFGARGPLASPDDFAGARVRVTPSRATDALIRALGATPVHVSGDDVAAAVASREIDGVEAALGTNSPDEGENHLTANLPFFAKTLTLFAGEDAYEELDGDGQAVIRKAARQTAAYAAAHPASESGMLRHFCNAAGAASAVIASREDLEALRQAAQPVYRQLERDVQTKALIAAIRELEETTPAAPAAAPPPGCEPEAPATARGRELPPATLNGTYRWRLTAAGARRVGVSPDDEDIGSVVTMTLRDGGWLLGDDDFYSGTFEVRGNRLVLNWPNTNTTNIIEFERHPDGDLDVKAVQPMDRGDEYVIASAPWQRVGPPVREVP